MNQSPKLKNGVDLSPPLKGWGAEAGKKGMKAKLLSIKDKRDSNPASNGPAKKRGSAVVRASTPFDYNTTNYIYTIVVRASVLFCNPCEF